MCNPAVLAATAVLTSVASTAMTIQAQSQQAENAQKVANYNAEVAGQQALDAKQRGAAAANQQRQKVRSLLSTQNAQLAGAGIETSSGTALNLAADTAYQGELDAAQIESNAMREAWGYETQATKSLLEGKATAANLKSQRAATLVGGIGNAVSSGASVYTMAKKW